MPKTDKKYSDAEAQRRFLAALKSAVNTPPKPLKDIPKTRAKKQSKKAKKKR